MWVTRPSIPVRVRAARKGEGKGWVCACARLHSEKRRWVDKDHQHGLRGHQPQGSQPPRRNKTSLSRIANRPDTRKHVVAHLLLSFYIIVAPLMRSHHSPAHVALRAVSASTGLASRALSCCHFSSLFGIGSQSVTRGSRVVRVVGPLTVSLRLSSHLMSLVPEESRQCDV